MNEGKKFDQGKPRYDLVPFCALDEIAQVLGHGARKYGDDNWRLVANGRARYIAAALRHISAYQQGEQSDSDSTLHHLAHAACSLMFILAIELEKGSQEPVPLDDTVLDALNYGLGVSRISDDGSSNRISPEEFWKRHNKTFGRDYGY